MRHDSVCASMNGRLGWFHIFPIVVTLPWVLGRVYLFTLMSLFFAGMCPVAGLMGHVVSPLVFWDSSMLFSTVAAPVYIPTVAHMEFFFASCWQHLLSVVSLDDSRFDGCEVMPHCGFGSRFLKGQWCWASFHVPVDHLYIFFGKFVSSDPLLIFLNWVLCSIKVDFYEFFVYLRHQLYQIIYCASKLEPEAT